ncbi:hypothetical protein [Acinetobacter bereziniae]|uniref:Uncharacterized protein n=1 Tax=Acinetobacter bereziniae NIPH 3 TaxID=1217651 RepID=N8YNV2_ACIBZ|nr:hypothetical protein [Acinetobacter bereziniae]ENV20940.1 hypothetical protein F963_03071 [Acinetobacter bereziniae NIPH 3]MDR6542983.1 hypothetical protein [Acinetobacter bereziniae]
MSITLKNNEKIFNEIIDIANNFDKDNENYLLAYSYFLNFFKKIDTIELDHIVIGISFTYSWMPTILKEIDLKNADDLVVIFNRIKKGNIITAKELLILKDSFNSSLVGTSKLLHFINPEQYAIWDSRVFRFLSRKEPHNYRLQDPKIYLQYLDLLENLKAEDTFAKFYKLMVDKVGYKISGYRALELAFFKGGESKKSAKLI